MLSLQNFYKTWWKFETRTTHKCVTRREEAKRLAAMVILKHSLQNYQTILIKYSLLHAHTICLSCSNLQTTHCCGIRRKWLNSPLEWASTGVHLLGITSKVNNGGYHDSDNYNKSHCETHNDSHLILLSDHHVNAPIGDSEVCMSSIHLFVVDTWPWILMEVLTSVQMSVWSRVCMQMNWKRSSCQLIGWRDA